MKILRTRAASVSRQGLCTALLVASLTAAVGVSPPHNTADADDTAPGPDNPQGLPHGTPNLTLPDLKPRSPGGLPGKPGEGAGGTDSASGIPATALAAYQKAAQTTQAELPGCHIPWQLIAGIGKVESHHGTMEGRHLNADGLADQKILGPRLTGGEFAVIKDTDGGRWDDDTEYDRAVGPTQFIPSTWESFGADGNGDGIKDPNNIFDASLGTARYLCANNRDLNNPRDLDKAVLAYNPSRAYVNAVLAWMRTYQSGNVTELPDAPGGSGITPGGSAPGGTSPSPGRTPHTKPTPPAKTVPPAKPTPPSTSKPVPPAKPTPPAEPKPPHKPGGDEGSKPTPAPATRLERMGDRAIEAVTVDVFEKRASVRAWDSAGKHTAGTRVRFEIVGVEGTESHFIGRDKKPVVTTGKDGIATAPQLLAGTRAEQFVVRATIVGGTGEGASADFDATVKVGTVDKLVRVGSEKPLQTGAGTAFTDKVELKASGNGKSVSGTTVTATVTSPDGKTDVKAGPYFKGKDGKPVRTLDLGTTDKEGNVTLPTLYADEHTGGYALRIVTANGTTLLLQLNVTGPQPETTKPADKPTGTPAGVKPKSTPAT
ncbi:lytic transglycosylase domain-containing protein [Streptomyces sp. NPDC046215]|uniref:Transglycosylase SLT domain-containing protein n=1 Tax=Streptomyces stramineus TaxID=173861 RepID=A0ABN0ZJH7_9ACTN